jgi:putative ABC transport system permease protein
LIDRLREDGGFRRVGLSTNRFIRDETTQTMVALEGSRDDAARVGADLRRVDGDYFAVMNLRAQRGRLFTTADRDSAPTVVIVSRAFVKQYLHDAEPIGKRIRRGVPTNPWLTIVGVVPDVMDRGVGVEVGPTLYVPYQQSSGDSFVLVLESDQPAAKVERSIRAAVASIDRDRVLDRFTALAQLLSESVGQERFEAVVTGTLAALATLLAATGIFGVTVFLVTERTREMAVRLALGATVGRVVRVVVFDDARWIAAACLAGLLITLALSKLAEHYAPQVTPPSVALQCMIAMGLVITGTVASALPALRVRRISLTEVLRAG